MKRFLMIAVLAVALGAFVAGTALAQTTNPPAQQSGPGAWMRNQGTDPVGTCPMVGSTTGMMGRGAPAWAGESDAVLKLLGMTAEELQAERLAGKSLAQIAEVKKVPVDKLVETILAAKKDALAPLVADGKLTQEQADLMLEHMGTMVKTMVERTTTGPMMRGGMGGGMRGGMRGLTGQGTSGLGRSF